MHFTVNGSTIKKIGKSKSCIGASQFTRWAIKWKWCKIRRIISHCILTADKVIILNGVVFHSLHKYIKY